MIYVCEYRQLKIWQFTAPCILNVDGIICQCPFFLHPFMEHISGCWLFTCWNLKGWCAPIQFILQLMYVSLMCPGGKSFGKTWKTCGGIVTLRVCNIAREFLSRSGSILQQIQKPLSTHFPHLIACVKRRSQMQRMRIHFPHRHKTIAIVRVAQHLILWAW